MGHKQVDYKILPSWEGNIFINYIDIEHESCINWLLYIHLDNTKQNTKKLDRLKTVQNRGLDDSRAPSTVERELANFTTKNRRWLYYRRRIGPRWTMSPGRKIFRTKHLLFGMAGTGGKHGVFRDVEFGCVNNRNNNNHIVESPIITSFNHVSSLKYNNSLSQVHILILRRIDQIDFTHPIANGYFKSPVFVERLFEHKIICSTSIKQLIIYIFKLTWKYIQSIQRSFFSRFNFINVSRLV